MAMVDLYIFTYGTLKPGGRYHQRYCSDGLVAATAALVKGELYDFPQLGYPAMTEGVSWVHGYLLHFQSSSSQIQQILQGLDVLEGYSPHRHSQENDYQRYEKPVFDLDCVPLRPAWVYQMSVEKVNQLGGIHLPEGDWRHLA
ncbi:MAG: gamma-glutamylcyclotransferase family protein [Cyanobacteria bacterium J06573_11]